MSKRVAVLTDRALIAAERRDEAKVEDARKRAEAHLREKPSETEVASVNASLTRCVAQLQVKRRQKRSGPFWKPCASLERGTSKSPARPIEPKWIQMHGSSCKKGTRSFLKGNYE